MTLITGTIKDSAGNPLSGTLLVVLNSNVLDTDTNSVLLPESYSFPITAGVVSISLKETYTSQTSYRFTFTKTGSPAPLLDFNAAVPNQASVNFNDLLPTGVTSDVLDTSLARLASILTSNPQYQELLKGSPYPAGNYDPTLFYKKGDLVAFDGGSYLYINPISTLGTPLTDAAYWQVVAARGQTGTGTAGNNTAFGSGWSGQTDAPSRNALYNEIITRAKTADLANLAPLASPALTGVPTVPTPAASSNDTTAINSAWATSKLGSYAPLNNPIFTGTPKAPTPATTSTPDTTLATTAYTDALMRSEPFVYARNTTNTAIAADATLLFPTEDQDTHAAYTPSTSTFVSPKAGYYLFTVNANLRRTTGSSTTYILYLRIGATNTQIIAYRSPTIDGFFALNHVAIINLAQGASVTLRFSHTSDQPLAWDNGVNINCNFISIRRISL